MVNLNRKLSCFLILVLVVSLFSLPGVIAPSHPYIEGSEDEFFSDGGTLPGVFWWGVDVWWDNQFGEPHEVIYERYSEAYQVIKSENNYESAQLAIDAAHEGIANIGTTLEEISFDDITFDTLDSGTHESVQELFGAQLNVLEYQKYSDALEATVEQQLSEGEVDVAVAEVFIEEAQATVNEVRASVEEQRYDLIQEVSSTGVSTFEADIAYENSFRNVAETKGFGGERFSEIAQLSTAAEVKAKIVELELAVASAREAGNIEEAEAAEALIELADSHLINCIEGIKYELPVTAENHLAETGYLTEKADELLAGETTIDEIAAEGLPTEPMTIEELTEQVQEKQESAADFLDNRYDALKEQYADDPAELFRIEEEAAQAQAAVALPEQVDDAVVQWTNEGVSEEEIRDRINTELKYAAGEEYLPPGLYTLSDGLGGEGEAGEIGSIIVVTRFNPETGAPEQIVEGWRDGGVDVKIGGAVVQGYIYVDPKTDSGYSFGPLGYSYTTPAGVTYGVPYAVPEGEKGFAPKDEFDVGDEVYDYPTEYGGKITYTSTGYYVQDAEGGKIVEEAYDQQDKYTYLGPAEKNGFGGTLDIEPHSVIITDSEGTATEWVATPELTAVEKVGEREEDKIVTYYDSINGKVWTADAAPHEDIEYKGLSTYEYNYGGEKWTYNSEDKSWKSESGVSFKVNGAPAPVGLESGLESEGVVRTSEGTWIYDSNTNSWTSSKGEKVYPSPNMGYRYDEDKKGFYDARGEFHSSNDYKVSDKYTGNVWAYDSVGGMWKTSDGNSYDPKTGNVIKADGTVVGPENRKPGEGSEGISWGYYEDSSGKGNSFQYSGYGGHLAYDPARQTYSYVNPGNNYYGGFKPGASQKDNYGNNWVLGSDGVWKNDVGGVATSGGVVYSYSGGLGHIQQPDGSWRAATSQAEVDAAKSEGTYSASGTPAVGSYGGYYSGAGPGTSGYTSGYGTYFSPEADAAAQAAGYSSAAAAAAAVGYGGYGYAAPGGGYGSYAYGSPAQYGGYGYAPSSGTPYSSYSGGYDPAAAAAGWPGGAYPGGVAPYSGPYVGPVGGTDGSGTTYGGYPSGDYSGGTYSPPSGSGDYSGGGYSGGDSGGSYTGGSTGGTTSGGDSGGSTGGGDSGGGSTGGDGGGGGDSGGGGTGMVISDVSDKDKVLENPISKFLEKIISWFRR